MIVDARQSDRSDRYTDRQVAIIDHLDRTESVYVSPVAYQAPLIPIGQPLMYARTKRRQAQRPKGAPEPRGGRRLDRKEKAAMHEEVRRRGASARI
jgi:hypothetical protein